MAPQFKKLTDCPENLRESIDWLIQVRHGGDGRGLERLAAALNTLIGESITKAEDSLQHERDKLQCSLKPWDTDSYCTKLDRLIKEKESHLKNPNDASNVDENALTSQINHLKSQKEDCIKSHYMDAQRLSSLTKEIDGAEGVVKRLYEFAERVSKNDDAKILNKLCSGVENFLGYKRGGIYDGAGVVYGDCDRLRDAVLVFLHGVLETVRNNPCIKNVDAYNSIITPIIQGLYSARYTGDKHFKDVMPIVTSGIEQYFKKVTDHNGMVTEHLEGLERAVGMDHSTESLTLSEQLDQLKQNANYYYGLATDVDDALEYIDDGLKTKLKIPIDIIKQSVTNFRNAAQNHDLEAECAKVDEKLKSIPEEVIHQIDKDVDQFISAQEAQVRSLKSCIESEFKTVLHKWITSVDYVLGDLAAKGEKSINDLQSEFEKAIKRLHKELKNQVNKIDVSDLSTKVSEFQKSFKDVDEQLKKLTKDNGGPIHKSLLQSTEDTIKEQLKSFVVRAYQVHDQLTNIKRSLNGWLTKNKDADGNPDGLSALSKGVNEKIESLKSEYNTIHEKLDGIKKFVEGNSDNQTLEKSVSNITAQVSALDDKVANDLNRLKQLIESAIEAVIVEFQKGVKEAAGDDSRVGAKWMIQEFRQGLGGDRSGVPTLAAWAKAAESGGEFNEALLQLHQVDNQFTKFQGILQALESVKHNNKNFFEAITEDLKDKVAQTALALNNASDEIVKSNFATTMGQYRGHVGITGEESSKTIHGAISAVSESVTSLGGAYSGATAADGVLNQLVGTLPTQMKQLSEKIAHVIEVVNEANEGLQRTADLATSLHSQLEGEHNIAFDSKFKDLKNAVSEAGSKFDEVKHELTTVVGATKVQLASLENMPEKINNLPHKGTSALIKLFKEKVESYKTEMKSSGELKKTKCIKDAHNMLDEAQRSGAGFMLQLGKRCKSAVTQAFETITQHVQSQYASSNNAHLEALKTCIAAQNAEIGIIIKKDLKTGLKGFLKTVSGVSADSQSISGPANKIAALKDTNSVKEVSVKFKAYLEQILSYVIEQLNLNPTSGRVGSSDRPTQSMSSLYDSNVSGIYAVYKNVGDVMQPLGILNSFNHVILKNIYEADEAIKNLCPSKFFSTSSNPLLDILKSGLVSFIEELKNVYVSKYSGSTDTFNWEISGNSEECAKVFLTISEILYRDLTKLKTICEGGSNAKQINLEMTLDGGRKVVNPLGDFFNQRGYKVPSGASTQDAELQNKSKMKGEQIRGLLYKHYNIFASLHSGDDNALCDGPLVQLYNNILDYHSVCHLRGIKNATSPNNAFQMLCWLSGLQYNPTYHPLKEYMKTLFKKAEKHKDTEYSKIQFVDLKVEATSPFSARDTVSALRLVTVQSHDILTTLLGHGHAGGIYACDFKTNPGNLSYPSDSGACFDLLVEILLRLNHQLSFLYEQCCHTTTVSGWLDCWYGKGVGGSNWQCNDLKCTECTGADKCTNNTICGLKSPLQSFLEDGLKGFLPHSFTKLGCKLECSVSNHNGITCITPMGFSDIGTVASHRQTGQRLKDVLRSFCGNENSPLNQLCSYLTCILRTPPRTLGEMFAFYYSFLHDWNDSGAHRKDGFNNAVIKANFGNSSTRFDITSMFKNTDHADNHLKGDLYSLISCSNTYIPARPCGPYMRPLCLFSRDMYSKEYSGYYLSWVVYLTETFYDLLKKLYEDCNKTCGSKGSTCYDKSCVRSCPISREPSSSSHDPLCKSIVDCTSTLPILCKYGFYFGSATLASGSKGDTMKKTCKEFILQLRNVCAGNSVLAKLVNITIPQYLFTIRAPFLLTTVVLWLLSLLYLIHIMVIRLDLLHIKSHLHSPSSHRIAAQSLLAAERVGRLAKISYLQP